MSSRVIGGLQRPDSQIHSGGNGLKVGAADGSQHTLCEKLIWGSDVPMVIERPQCHQVPNGTGPEMGYIYCLKNFKSSIDTGRLIDAGQSDCLCQRKQGEVMQAIVTI